MTNKEAKTLVQYLVAIPEMEHVLRRERAELEADYNYLGAANMDGMPRGGMPGNPVEALAVLEAERGTGERLAEIDHRLELLEEDRTTIAQSVDSIFGRYKTILLMRYKHGYSWGKVSCCLGAPDSTVRHWHDRALEALGMALDETPRIEELLRRASRARI